MWVPPFGYRRINSCLQIPGAFRSLPRPSSLLEAKASSVRSSSLSRTFISESTLRLSSVSSYFTRFAYEIAVLFATRKNSNLLIRLNLFFFFTSLSLSVLSMIFGFPLPVRKGLQRYKLFLNLQIFLYNFLKNLSFSPNTYINYNLDLRSAQHLLNSAHTLRTQLEQSSKRTDRTFEQ